MGFHVSARCTPPGEQRFGSNVLILTILESHPTFLPFEFSTFEVLFLDHFDTPLSVLGEG